MDEILKEAAKQAPIVLVFAGGAYLALQRFLEHLRSVTSDHATQMAARDAAFREQANECHAVTERATVAIDRNTEALGENTATMRDLRHVVEDVRAAQRHAPAAA